MKSSQVSHAAFYMDSEYLRPLFFCITTMNLARHERYRTPPLIGQSHGRRVPHRPQRVAPSCRISGIQTLRARGRILVLVGKAQADIDPDFVALVDVLQGGHGEAVVDAGKGADDFVDLPVCLEAELEAVPTVVGARVVAEIHTEESVWLEGDDVFVNRDFAVETELQKRAGCVVEIPNEGRAGCHIRDFVCAKDDEEFVAIGFVDVSAFFLVLLVFMLVRMALFDDAGCIAEIIARDEKHRAEIEIVACGEIPLLEVV